MEMQKSKMFKLKKECMWQCKLQLILSMKICALCMTHAPWLPDHDSCAMRHTMPAMHSLATSKQPAPAWTTTQTFWRVLWVIRGPRLLAISVVPTMG